MRKFAPNIYSRILILLAALLLSPTGELIRPVAGFTSDAFVETLQNDNEYTLKSVYMYNFTRYIEWSNTGNKFVILVVGDSPIIPMLNIIAKSKMVNNQQIVVKKADNNMDVNNCDMIFLPAAQNDKLSTILLKMDNNSHALLVTEAPGDAEQGADINFILDGNKLKFEINNFSLKKHGLKASSQLLKLAVNVFE